MRRPAVRGRHGLARRLPAATWLVLVWVLLWGTFTWANLITGSLVAFVVMSLLPLPYVAPGGQVHLVGVVRFVVRFVHDLVISSVHVAWRAVAPGKEPRSAVVAVHLRSRSDLILTITAETLTLVPGSLVIDVERSTGTIYAHVFDINELEDVDAFRRMVLDLEARVIRAFGPPSAIKRLDAARTVRTKGGRR